MKTTAMATGALLLLFVTGCKNQASTAASTEPVKSEQSVAQNAAANPEELGQIGAQIKAHPDDAKKILSERGMTEASFEKAIRTVSSDPALSKRYAEAYKKAQS